MRPADILSAGLALGLTNQISNDRDSESGPLNNSDPLFSQRLSHDSTSVSEQRVIERAVLASESEPLPNLQGYLKLASEAEWMRVNTA